MKATLLVLCVALAGCASPRPMRTAFDPAEYAAFARPGTGVIDGQAFLKQRGGAVVFGAGNVVALNPVTSFSSEWYERSVINDEELAGGDVRAKEFNRQVQADGEGRFRFDGLPAGDYYITCRIEWYRDEWHKTGGIAHARVTVRDGEVTRAVVTR